MSGHVLLKRHVRPLARLALATVLLAACGGGPILANAPIERPTVPPLPSPTARPADPQPITFPRDDGPHDRLTEWWYYTGHLSDAAGRRFGFEYVVFRAERGAFPVSWAAHLAITDETGGRFLYSQRAAIGSQVHPAPRHASGPLGFAFTLPRSDGTGTAWTMARATNLDHLDAHATSDEVRTGPGATGDGEPAAIGLDLTLSGSQPVLHNGNGWIEFGPSGGSYYYSRPRLAAKGTIQIGEQMLTVTGSAWFDHQWGDFIAVGGGWDWFAVNLDDGTDLTLSVVRDDAGATVLAYGTLVQRGIATNVPAPAFRVTSSGRWTSPVTGATYPAGWQILIPDRGLTIDLRPTVPGQELDTRPTTGVVYWEGSQRVSAQRLTASGAIAIGGEAYVELTGYGPGSPNPAPAASTSANP